MSMIQRLINAFTIPRRMPRPGVLLNRRPEDSWRSYPADGLTPQRLVAILREADNGDASAQMALFEQMEEKDAHLYSVASTRRLAVTGLAWEIVSAARMPGWTRRNQASLADETAAYCNDVLRELPGFEETLRHLSLAVGRNIAIAEMVWEATPHGLRLAEVLPVDFGHITVGELGEVRLLTDGAKYEGIELPPDKFIVHTTHAASGHPLRGGLLRVTALAYLGKHFAIKDWLIFAEVFGMPVRVARYAPNATPEEKQELLDMLRRLGADATGIFSKAVDIEIKQSRYPGETNLYENLCLYFDREISKAWLGQTLTTDTIRMLASAGAAQVHNRVRRDLRDDDLRKEAHTLRRDLLGPMVRMHFGPDAPVPYFRRVLEPGYDPQLLSKTLDIAVNRLGARVPTRWVHAALGLPEAAAGEAVIPGTPQSIRTDGGSAEQD